MKRKSIFKLTYAVVLLMALLLVVSCGKKDVQTDPGVEDTVTAEDTVTDETTSDAIVETEVEEVEEDDTAMADAQEETMENNAAEMAREAFVEDVIYFDYDSYAILPSEENKLQTKADWMKNNPSAKITIEGHCDERGTTEYNLALGDRRASKAKGFLENLGVDGSRITIVSYGEEKPAASGHNEQAWAQNRRAKFVIE